MAAPDLCNSTWYRFHYPDDFLVLVFFKFFSEDGVLAGHVVCEGKVVIPCGFLYLALSLECFFVAFDIFRKQILSTDFIEISKMVDASVRKEPDLIKRFSNLLLLAPVDIPIIILSLFVHAVGQTLLDAVGEVGFEFDLGTESRQNY